MSRRRRPSVRSPRQRTASWLHQSSARFGAVPLVSLATAAAVLATVIQDVALGVLVLAAMALGAAIAAFWLSLRSLFGDRPMAAEEAYGLATPLGEVEHKRTVLRALKDLEYERSLGKIAPDDYAELRKTYRREAQNLLHLQRETDRSVIRRVEQMVAEHLASEGLTSASDDLDLPTERGGVPSSSSEDSARDDEGDACPKCRTRNDEDARFCKRCGKALSALFAFGILVVLLLATIELHAQPSPSALPSPAPPAATRTASTGPTGSAQAPPLPDGHPPMDAPQGAPGMTAPQSAPSGMPELPPGHPDISGRTPRRTSDRMPFRPPADTISVDADLPRDSLEAQIVDGSGTPLSDVTVTLDILRRSVAKGDSSAKRQGKTGEEGVVRFDALETGSAASYRVTTERGPAIFSTEPFTLTAPRGLRILLHAYEWTADPTEARVDVAAFLVLDLTQDAIGVDQMLQVLTVGPKAWVPEGLTVELPDGYRAFRGTESMGGAGATLTSGGALQLSGTFTPGQQELRFGYQIPLDGGTSQTVDVPLPPGVSRARVIATLGSQGTLSADGFPPPRMAKSPDGKPVQVTELQIPLGGRGIPRLHIRLDGLPSQGSANWIALLVALVVAAAGLSTAWSARRRGEVAEAERDDLSEAQTVLLDELRSLERMRRNQDVSESSYTTVRASLVDALARLERRLAAADGP